MFPLARKIKHGAKNSEENFRFQRKNVGSSARLVLPAILGEWGAWREIHNLHMSFVILKVRNLFLCTVSRGPFYFMARSPGS